MSDPWLVVIDAQRIFADPASAWGSPMWPDAAARLGTLLPLFRGRTILTRWVPPAADARVGSWDAYMQAWPFADRPADDAIVGAGSAFISETSPRHTRRSHPCCGRSSVRSGSSSRGRRPAPPSRRSPS